MIVLDSSPEETPLMNLSTEFLKMYDTEINRKVFLAHFLASEPNFYL